jgi:hypothetical protein
MRRAPHALLLAAAVLGGSAAARRAAADPTRDRIATVPTAWLPTAGAVIGQAGVDSRGVGDAWLGYGLGGLAEVVVETDTDVRIADSTNLPHTTWLGRAAFRLGARQDAWFPGQPAVALGVRATFAGDAKVGEAYLVASRTLGPVRLHGGADLIDAATRLDAPSLGATLRPLAGLEWTPAQYPRTTLLADLAWVPRLAPTGAPTLEWIAGWGVRYDALGWGAIELLIRNRQAEGVADLTAMVRLDGVWGR